MNSRFIVIVLLLSSCLSIHEAYGLPNLALGANTSASDNGWGGGSTKSDLVDGLASYYDTWAHGLAAPWSASGDFHVVLDFGHSISFNNVVAWWHSDAANAANIVQLQIWDSVLSSWDTIFSTNNAIASMGSYDDPATWSSSPTAFSFATATSDKLRLVYDNSEIYNRSGLHGWLYEVGVFNTVPEPTTIAIFTLGLISMAFGKRRKLT